MLHRPASSGATIRQSSIYTLLYNTHLYSKIYSGHQIIIYNRLNVLQTDYFGL